MNHRDFESTEGPPPPSTRAYLELRLAKGPVSYRPLREPQVVIGRSPSVELQLDHDTVSRRHAELSCDPFGRFWVRDLGSTNGTLVNGERIKERALSPGDRIRVGDYTILLHLPATIAQRAQPEPEAIVDDSATDGPSTLIKTLLDVEPPKISATQLSTLMELNRRLLVLSDPAERLGALCELVVREEFHGSLAVALRVRDGNVVKMLAGPYRPAIGIDDGAPSPYISRRVLKALRDRPEPVLASNLPSSAVNLELTMSADVLALSAIACPLRRDEQTMDLLYVTLPPQYGTDEWLALVGLAAEAFQQAENAWSARRHAEAHAAVERELDMARRIQRQLVPSEPVVPGLDVAIGFEPCKWIGGDYADVVPMPDGRVLFTVVDVCGKGLQAALVTFAMHTLVRATIEAGRSLPEMMDRLNRHLCSYLPEDSFATMVAVAVDTTTGDLECINAGHPPALILTPNGCSRQLQVAKNPALGVMDVALTAQTERLGSGDLLVLYTDGLTELKNSFRQMLGEEQLGAGLAQIYASLPTGPADKLAAELSAMLERYRGDQMPEDDSAFLLARRS